MLLKHLSSCRRAHTSLYSPSLNRAEKMNAVFALMYKYDTLIGCGASCQNQKGVSCVYHVTLHTINVFIYY